jgi:hypothetical protein
LFSSLLAGIHGPDKSKEADISFTPTSRINNKDELAIPTVVVEVGYWEPVRDLHQDAKDWLRMKDGEEFKVSNNGSYSSFNPLMIVFLRST